MSGPHERDGDTGPPDGPVDGTAEQPIEPDAVLDPAAAVEDGGPEVPEPPAPGEPEAPADGSAGEGEGDALVLAEMALAERTADLQRLQAEFVNYKRRVERDRDLLRENVTFAALSPITEVLDTIDRAREHEPLEGGFKAVAEQLERNLAQQGLVRYGQPGDAFDPTVHEALSHLGTDPDVTVTTCKVVAKSGYKIGERVVRAAQVLVVDPAEPGAAG